MITLWEISGHHTTRQQYIKYHKLLEKNNYNVLNLI